MKKKDTYLHGKSTTCINPMWYELIQLTANISNIYDFKIFKIVHKLPLNQYLSIIHHNFLRKKEFNICIFKLKNMYIHLLRCQIKMSQPWESKKCAQVSIPWKLIGTVTPTSISLITAIKCILESNKFKSL